MKSPSLKHSKPAKEQKAFQHARFSRWYLIVIGLVFAVVGSLYLARSFATNAQGDLNNDGVVNITDLSILLSNYSTTNTVADINSDGTVNILDLSILLSNYGQSIATSCNLYASPSGNNNNNGSLGSPYLTAQKLFDSLSAGQTGCLRGGTYTTTGLSITHGGSQASPITLTSYPNEQASIVDSAPGGATHNFIYVSNAASYVVLDRLNIDGGGQAIKVESTHITISNSNITNHRVGQSCFLLGGSSGAADNDTIRGNIIHGCGSNTNQDHCIYDHNGTGTVIQYNVIYDCQAYAIQLYPVAVSTLFDHNTTDGGLSTTRGGVLFGGETAPVTANTTVSNNIITYAPTGGLTSFWGGPVGTGNVASNNCLWNAVDNGTGYTASGTITADPLFVDRTNHNYNLQAGSPCGGKGAL